MSTLPQKRRRSTVAELFAIPEDQRFHELIDGEIIEKSAATGEHGASQVELAFHLRGPFGRRPGDGGPGGWWFASLLSGLINTVVIKTPEYQLQNQSVLSSLFF